MAPGPLTVPPDVNIHAMVNLATAQGSNVFQHYLSDPAVTDETPSGTAAPLSSVFAGSGASNGGNGAHFVRTDTSARVRSRCTNAGINDAIYVATLGWLDRRGRDA